MNNLGQQFPSIQKFLQKLLIKRISSKSALVTLFLLALLIRVAITIYFVEWESPRLWEYRDVSKNLYETGTLSFRVPGIPTAFMAPGYPVIISFIYKVFGIGTNAYVTIASLLLVFEIAIPFLVSWVAFLLWGRIAGRVAFIFALYWPMFLIMNGRLHYIPIYIALLILACGIMLSNKGSIIIKGLFVGITMGFYSLLRFDAIVQLFPFLYYISRCPSSDKKAGLKKLLASSLLVMSFMLFLSPWLIRNYNAFGEFVLGTSSGWTLLLGHNEKATGSARDPWPAAKRIDSGPGEVASRELMRVSKSLKFDSPRDEVIADAWFRNKAIAFIVSHPKKEVELALKKIYYYLVFDFTHPISRVWPIWVPSLIGLILGFIFWLRFGRSDVRKQMLWLVFAMQMSISVVFIVLPRYRMIVEFVPLVFFAGWVAERLRGFLNTKRFG